MVVVVLHFKQKPTGINRFSDDAEQDIGIRVFFVEKRGLMPK